MSVLSCRSLSLRTAFCAGVGSFGSAICGSLSKLLPVLLIGLTACVSERPYHVFDSGHLSDKEWARMRQECDYEAEKATASAPVNIAYYRWERLYISCIELKGVKYLGMSDELPQLKQ